jgi:hypothetical protein
MKPSGCCSQVHRTKLAVAVGSRESEVIKRLRAQHLRLRTANRKSRSSVWLEHYTDNVGVSSSNLLGTTKRQSKVGSRKSEVKKTQDSELRTKRLIFRGISSAG